MKLHLSTRRMKQAVALSFATVLVLVVVGFMTSAAMAQGAEGAEKAPAAAGAANWAFIAAAISAGLACIGAGLAVAYVGAAAVGAVAEKPEIAGRTLIFVGLAEGIAIYGLIVAIMILGRV